MSRIERDETKSRSKPRKVPGGIKHASGKRNLSDRVASQKQPTRTSVEVRKRVCQAYSRMTGSGRIDDIEKHVKHVDSVNPGFSSRIGAFIGMKGNGNQSYDFENMTVGDISCHATVTNEDVALDDERTDKVTVDCAEAIETIAKKHNLPIPAVWACMVESIAIDVMQGLQD